MVTLSIVGCAHIHIPGFVKMLLKRQEAGQVQIKHVWDPNPARAEKRAGELPGSKVVKSASRIWNDPEVRGVVIGSETNLHKKLVMAATMAGKHLFVEKPLGMGSKDSYAMAAAIKQARVHFTTGYFNRGKPEHLFIKQQVEQGNFGKVTRVRGSNCHNGSLGGWFDSKPDNPADDWRWMADPAIAGCGAFGDLGTHLLDILMWLMGPVEQATAQIDVGTNRYNGTDETGEGLLRFKNGAIGTLAGAWTDVANPCTLLVSGTEGHAAVINGKLYFTSKRVAGAEGKEPVPAEQMPAALPHQFEQFVDAVLGLSSAALVSPDDAAARVSVMEAMYLGAAKGKWIKPK
ncbi:MAG: Gfo/Idh/MocA family oxidoreductase [Phycisphaeraceae bacterium]